jgi:V-type H+-transporting ATPase subunit C
MQREEDELRQKSADYVELSQALSSIERKKGGSLMMRDLSDVITPDTIGATATEMQRDDFFPNTEYLTTLIMIVPKNSAKDWEQTYESLCSDLVETADGSSISPVVPGSSLKLLEQEESAVYQVTLLRGKYEMGFYEEEEEEEEKEQDASNAGASETFDRRTYHEGKHTDYVEEFIKVAREHR